MPANLRARSLKGVLWTSFESFGIAALSLGVFAVMAHVLEPHDFGVVALAGVFTFSFNLIVGSSFSDALVQRTELVPEHLDVAFWSTLAMALALTGLCYAGADLAARWLHEPALAHVLPWLSWIMPIGAIGAVQMAMFRRGLRFGMIAIRSAAGRTVGAIVGVVMALTGFGVWSLIGQQIAGVLTTSIAMAIASEWRPHFRFSFDRFRELWKFGIHVSASHTVNGMSQQAVNLLIGSLFGTGALGYFNVAWRMVQLLCSLTSSAVYHVGFSAFSRLQEDRAAVTRAMLQATRLSCLVGFPLAAGMALLAGPIITVMFGHKWSASVPLLIILALDLIHAFYAMFYSACYRAMGRPEWVFGLGLLGAVTGLAAVVLLAPAGIMVVAIGWVGQSFLLMPLEIMLLKRILRVRLSEILAPALVPAVATVIMSAAVAVLLWGVGDSISNLDRLLAGVPVGVVTYVLAIALLSPNLMRVATSTVKIMVTPSHAAQR
jgi:PST family polysaccharide transporter